MDQRLHGGILNYEEQTSGEYLDYSVNINPLGVPDFVKTAVADSILSLDRYPDPECRRLCRRLAEVHDLGETQVTCGNGAGDLIYQLVNSMRPKRAMVLAPTFSEYEFALGSVGCRVEHFFLSREQDFRPDMGALCQTVAEKSDLDLIFFCNPNNPTGISVSRSELEELVKLCEKKNILLVVDECFQEFLDEPDRTSVIPLLRQGETSHKNLIVLRAFTKTYAIAGLRLGYLLVADPSWKVRLRERRQPWNVSLPAQKAGLACLSNQGEAYVKQAHALIRSERARISDCMQALGYRIYPSEANFLFFEVPWESQGEKNNPETLFSFCMERKILIRDCANYRGVGAGSYRICVRTEAENKKLLQALKEAKEAEEVKK